ncbi:MAG: ATP-binding protein [Acidobacteriota bacterium]
MVDDLRRIGVFADLGAADLEWLAARMTARRFAPGDVVFREGGVADQMAIIFEGELHGRRESDPREESVYRIHAGQVSGMLPFSRLKELPLTFRAVTPVRMATLGVEHFQEMLARIPALGPRLVSLMSDRIRENTRAQEQRQKLAALGKLSAGLAHELNNPAAAVRRASHGLREAVETLRAAGEREDFCSLGPAQRAALAEVERELAARGAPAEDSLARSDREEALAGWLERRSVPEARELAMGLADAGAEPSVLDRLAGMIPPAALGDALARLSASLLVGRLLNEIDNSAGRISELVRAIKDYSYMDQGGELEIDIHTGIESTLLMLRHELKNGVDLVRDYDRTLPRIRAWGGELNQVWTNLIENAVDAMGGKGELRIRTFRELNSVVVEVGDTGPGIPPEIKDRIFEPFFTTKSFGNGTGLGLDTVYRIVHNHHGEIRVESKPGDTRFQVRLPVAA